MLAIISITAPWAATNYLLKYINAHSIALAKLRDSLSHDLTGASVLIGDCTVSPLEVNSEKHNWKTDVRIIGFGGSAIKEWFYLINNNFEKFEKANQVVVATVSAPRFSYLYASYISFLPYLMTWQQIYDYSFKENKITFAEMFRFFLGSIVESYPNSQELRYRFYKSFVPEYEAWNQYRSQTLQMHVNWRNEERHDWNLDVNTHTDEHEYFRRIAELSHRMKGRLYFMLNARSSEMRDKTFVKERDAWLGKCAEFGVRCVDMTETMPDIYFKGGDGLHLMSVPAIQEYGAKVESVLQGRKVAKE
ncbi:MAG: hypothetical protein ACXVC0_06730 [Bdellovibrionota bacterium]